MILLKKQILIKNLGVITLSAFLCSLSILPTYAGDKSSTGLNEQEPTSNGDTYEYQSMDEEGNITTVYLPEVDSAEIEEERIKNASSFDLVIKIGNNEEVLASFDTYEEAVGAQVARQKSRSVGTTSVKAVNDYSNIKYGVVNFRTKTSRENTYFTDANTGKSNYMNGSYAADGAFLGYCNTEKTQVKFMQGGVTGCVSANDVTVITTETSDNVYVNSYKVINGNIIHYISTDVTKPQASSVNVGPMQDYMKDGITYFSYDGHYFYTNFNTMIDDYKAGTYAHSINPNQPYYNYYQYLSHRTQTNYTAADLNKVISSKASSASLLQNMGQYFIDYQNTYGANALLMLGVAANESTWGTSTIAIAKNNLFGHKAYDSSPGESADSYATPQASIEDHAKNYISRDYMDPLDAGKKYYGSNLGDKASGMGVKYASDPYWGEKAAAISYIADSLLGKKDFAKYEIGIKTTTDNVNVRADAYTEANKLYSTDKTLQYPVVILAEKSGVSVSGNNVWYKIQSDPTLSADRTQMTQDVCTYDFANAYGYISSYYITPVKYSNVESGNRPNEHVNLVSALGLKNAAGYLSGFSIGSSVESVIANMKKADSTASITVKNASGTVITSGTIATGMSITTLQGSLSSSYSVVVYGDVNGDGKISPADYTMTKNHIVDTHKLTGVNSKASDASKDGKISPMDYAMIKNHIVGAADIQQ